jgi:hypothetical protein
MIQARSCRTLRREQHTEPLGEVADGGARVRQVLPQRPEHGYRRHDPTGGHRPTAARYGTPKPPKTARQATPRRRQTVIRHRQADTTEPATSAAIAIRPAPNSAGYRNQQDTGSRCRVTSVNTRPDERPPPASGKVRHAEAAEDGTTNRPKAALIVMRHGQVGTTASDECGDRDGVGRRVRDRHRCGEACRRGRPWPATAARPPPSHGRPGTRRARGPFSPGTWRRRGTRG